MRFLILIISGFILTSCRQSEKSEEVMKQALNIYYRSKLNADAEIDSSFALTNKALELDDKNVSALNHKITLLFRKKNSKGLIKVSDKLIQLIDKPYYLGQKAMFLELDGKLNEAQEYYSKAIQKYEELLKTDTLNFDLMFEYVWILEAAEDTVKANKILTEMRELDFEDYQIEILDIYKEQSVSKEQVIKYWNGEITYDQIVEN